MSDKIFISAEYTCEDCEITFFTKVFELAFKVNEEGDVYFGYDLDNLKPCVKCGEEVVVDIKTIPTKGCPFSHHPCTLPHYPTTPIDPRWVPGTTGDPGLYTHPFTADYTGGLHPTS